MPPPPPLEIDGAVGAAAPATAVAAIAPAPRSGSAASATPAQPSPWQLLDCLQPLLLGCSGLDGRLLGAFLVAFPELPAEVQGRLFEELQAAVAAGDSGAVERLLLETVR